MAGFTAIYHWGHNFEGQLFNADGEFQLINVTGMTTAQSGGNLTIGTGTASGNQWSYLTPHKLTFPAKFSFIASLSQRIANQVFQVELVSVNRLNLPDDENIVGLEFSGTSANAATLRVQGFNGAMQTQALTISSTATASLFEIEVSDDKIFVYQTPSNTLQREQIAYHCFKTPSPFREYRLRIVARNTAVAASSTNFVLNRVSSVDYDMKPCSIIQTPFGGFNIRDSANIHHIVAAASTNPAVVKASTGRLIGWFFQNTTASIVYVKLHNTNVVPTAGTGVVLTIGVPANGVAQLVLPNGINFNTGIGRTIVAGAADNDTTAVAANAVVGDLFFL